MENRVRRPAILRMICAVYIALEALFFVCATLISGKETGMTLMLIDGIAVVLIAFAVTIFIKITDNVHGVILVSVGQIAAWVVVLSTGHFELMHISAILTTIVACLYEKQFLMKFQTTFITTNFLGMILMLAVFLHAPMEQIRGFSWTAGFVVIADLVMTYIIGNVEHYRQVIRENSQSSQDMLKVVQMKRREAQQAAQAKSQFLSNMSHEIRTPIHAILGMDEIILRESNEANIVDYAGKIQNAGDTLLALVNDILDFSKLESNRVELLPETYQTQQLFEELYDMVRLRTEEKGLKLYFDLAKDLPRGLYGDALRVKQILINVLNNAVKYTNEGQVILKAAWKKNSAGEAVIMVAVEDTGIGIKEENLDRIFHAFERVDSMRNKHIEGTGLGMTISKNLANMMQGDIWAESEYGVGSTFHVLILQGISDETAMGDFIPGARVDTKTTRQRSFSARKARVLVVDDNEMNLSVAKGLLKKTLIQTDTATSGLECLAMVSRQHYDLIFMDHMMPEMDGVATYERLKALEDGRYAQIPVVALTANAITGAREFYLKAGFASYLSKPIRGNQLESVLLEFLPPQFIEYEERNEASPKNYNLTMEGIDLESGLSYAGHEEETYKENLQVFMHGYKKHQERIMTSYEADDRQRYIIEVHALKSNARSIGANALGELAYAHEQAGKIGDFDYIKNHLEELMVAWEKVVRSIQKAIGDGIAPQEHASKMLPIDENIYARKKEKILTAIQDYEMDEVERRLKDLLDYDLSNERRSRVERALEAADLFNYKLVESLVSEES